MPPSASSPTDDSGFLAPRPGAQPTDQCFRCGKETPAGVALCDDHNPSRLRGPSATQMHATVFLGVVIGVVGFLVLARGAVSTSGPFPAAVTAAVPAEAGSLAVSFDVTNEGSADAMADCRFTRDGVPRPDDIAFRSPSLPAGETVSLERVIVSDPDSYVAYDAEQIEAAIVAQVAHGRYPSSTLYHRPDTSDQMLEILATAELYTQKRFFEADESGAMA